MNPEKLDWYLGKIFAVHKSFSLLSNSFYIRTPFGTSFILVVLIALGFSILLLLESSPVRSLDTEDTLTREKIETECKMLCKLV